jgi:glycerophosphoryl diester phosphodiesterase
MKIIAHRGDSAAFPENTPASWDSAFANGAFAIEADIRYSADGTGICSHDPTLNRLFGRDDRADALSFAELSALSTHAGDRVSTFAEVLAYAATGRPVVLDLKDESAEGLDRLWADIESAVPEAYRHLVIAGCHGLPPVNFFAAKGGVTILGFIPNPDLALEFYRAGASLIRLWESDVSHERVAALKAAGANVWVTTGHGTTGRKVGDADATSLTALAAAGVDGVLINDVSMTKTILEALR